LPKQPRETWGLGGAKETKGNQEPRQPITSERLGDASRKEKGGGELSQGGGSGRNCHRRLVFYCNKEAEESWFLAYFLGTHGKKGKGTRDH